jgi:hypothetical protein
MRVVTYTQKEGVSVSRNTWIVMLVHAANPAITKSFGEGDFRGSPFSPGISETIFDPPQEMDVLNSIPRADDVALPHALLHTESRRQRAYIIFGSIMPDRPGVRKNTLPL